MATSGVAFRPEEPNVARMYDYMLGGKDNFPADRAAVRQTFDVLGEDVVRGTVRQNRRFLGRAVRHLAREAGIRQFLDIGTGLPTMGNVHEVARGQIAPDSRVVYVDNDRAVISHAGYTLHGVEGTAIVDHDLRDPSGITGDARVRSLLRSDQPIAVLLVAILHFVADADDPAGIVAALMASAPPGSFLVISHLSADHYAEADKAADVYEEASSGLYLRSRAAVGSCSAGCRWKIRARSSGRRNGTRSRTPRRSSGGASLWCGIARKPLAGVTGEREALAGLGVEVGRERALLGDGDVAAEVLGVRGADDRGGQAGVAEREPEDELHRRYPGLGQQLLDAGGLPVPLADAGLLGERADPPVLLLRGRAARGAAADEGARAGVHRLG